MFSIIENVYSGWQYVINLLSLVGGNFHIVLENIPRFSNYIANFFSSFSAPDWFSFTIIATLGFGFVFRLCHWG
ncbi:MAG: hypothetical protein NC205_06890 [Prevotella sp.]|nr:hypothetical protein [Alistipes senegalensis]MCM1358305.1 hypothetical protein [Prevotella sp.]